MFYSAEFIPASAAVEMFSRTRREILGLKTFPGSHTAVRAFRLVRFSLKFPVTGADEQKHAAAKFLALYDASERALDEKVTEDIRQILDHNQSRSRISQ